MAILLSQVLYYSQYSLQCTIHIALIDVDLHRISAWTRRGPIPQGVIGAIGANDRVRVYVAAKIARINA